MIKKIILLFFICFFCLSLPIKIKAEESTDILAKQIDEYIQKLGELATSKNTLANQVKIINSQVELTLLKITQTENSIKNLENEINNLTVEISNLDIQLDQLSSLYVIQIIENYKLQKKIPPFTFLISSRLNNFLEQYKYLSNVQKSSQNTLINMETVRTNYNNQKTTKIKKQQELETLQKTLASQKINLNNQKIAKNKLLESTKNDEKKYQQLLTEAQNQLNALRNFSSSAGGSSCLASSPGSGSDGNFYSQRDPRWCNQYIGNSKDTIGEVGCFISSLSIAYKKLGFTITPSIYAADSNNFWVNTAYMVALTPPSGYTYKQVPYNISVIDNELKNGRYVITQMKMNNSAGMHFIVIISGSNGNYMIHDPWFGADLKFSDRYSPSSVLSLRLITR
ncbi:MAG: papain-like cysteine protease family protein [Candidatus Shapirobacteria bacterium]|nr:papain-like cysteine protease family protein [Candidatus Shapirobacteria bacterium]